VFNDTLFLASLAVVDYSILLGIPADASAKGSERELRIGIIGERS